MWGYIEDTPGGRRRRRRGGDRSHRGDMEMADGGAQIGGHIILEAADSDKLGKRGAVLEIINNSAIVHSA